MVIHMFVLNGGKNMQQSMSSYWKTFGFFLILSFSMHSQAMNSFSLKKIVKNTVILYGCYILLKEASYHYAMYNYNRAVKQKDDLTCKLLNNDQMPDPTFYDCANRQQQLLSLQEKVQTQKKQTLISKYFG